MAQITKKFVGNNQIDGDKIRLDNAESLKARNAANSGDVNILSVDSSDRVVFPNVPQSPTAPTVANDLANKAYVDAQVGGASTPPTQQVFTTAGAATYTPTSGSITYIKVRMIGGGGGGGGGGSPAAPGDPGEATTFEDTVAPFLVSAGGGGAGGSGGAAGGAGGTYDLDGRQGFGINGGSGGGFNQNAVGVGNAFSGPSGGDAPFFGGGGKFGTGGAGNGEDGVANTGGGGQGGSAFGGGATTGAGGGSGAYVEFIIPGPLEASYDVYVANGGVNGGGGTGGGNGGVGADGFIIIEEYY